MIDASTGALDEALYDDTGVTDTLAQLDAAVSFDAHDTSVPDVVNDNQIPEPASISLLMLAGGAFLSRRRTSNMPR